MTIEEENKKKLEEYVHKQDPALIRQVISKTNKFIKVYNALCNRCKKKLSVLSGRGFQMRYDDYCDKCQARAKDILQ